MKCALVSPTSLLRDTQPYSNYHLALAYKVIYERAYQEYYKERSKAGDYIILDNGAVEKKGRSVPMKDIVLAALLIKPSVVILPDFLFDRERTLDELEDAMRSPAMQLMRRVLPDTKLCAVVQGLEPDDWLECFKILNTPGNGIDMLGIPKITGHIFGKRLVVLEKIQRRVKKPCHLLGVWWQSTLEDIRQEGKYDFVMGIDTPKPLRLASHGYSLDDWDKMPRGQDFLDRPSNGMNIDLLKHNCEAFVEVCRG
jgi:hypothetical protein